MLFLANENFPRASVVKLREAGFDVAAVMEDSPGATDQQVLIRSDREKRIVLTFDRDYGELIYKHKNIPAAGVIYFRFSPFDPEEPARYFLQAIALRYGKFEGMFTVIERTQMRQRRLKFVERRA
jgi:predicted nuclease of predicted toxin-antitoxin system